MKEKIWLGLKGVPYYWRIILLIYVLQLVVSLPIGIQVFQVIEASIGDSLSLGIIEEGFNRTVFEDFLNSHGASITPLIGMLRWIVLVFLLLSVFLHAGIFGSLSQKSNGIRSFVNHAMTLFYSFIKLSLFYLALMLLWSGLIWGVFFMIIGNPIEDPSSEKVLVWGGGIALVVHLLGLAQIMNWSIFSKLHCATTNARVKKSILFGLSKMKTSWFPSLGIIVSYVIIHLILIGVYYFISQPIGASRLWLIMLLFIIQQLVVYVRIGLRVGLYSSLDLLRK